MNASDRKSVRWQSVLKWIAIGTGGLLAVLLLTLALVDWNRLKAPLERLASRASGRSVRIEGPLDVHIWSLTPRASLQGLVIGNPPWETTRPMARIEKLDVQLKLLPLLKGDVILPRLELTRPDVALRRDAQGRANWTFESTQPSNAAAEKPPKLPVVRNFLIQSGKLTMRDEILKLEVDGTVQAHESLANQEQFAFRVQGKGTINKERFALQVGGGPLVNLDPDQSYPFKLLVKAGDIRLDADGSIKKPFDLGRLEFNAHAEGGDLADLYYLTQLALPNTPPFELAAHVERDVKVIKVTKLQGTLGQSDVSGELTVDASRKRPVIRGVLESRKLRLKDLVASLGTRTETSGTLQGAGEAPKPSRKGVAQPAPADPNARLFPTARLQVNRVRAMNADVSFRARSIEAGALPFKQVRLEVRLEDGVLAIAPFEFKMPQGQLSGAVRIDAREKIPRTHLDLRVKNVELEQLKGKKPGAQPPLEGIVQARARLEGRGDSVHDVMAGADGQISIVLPHGQVNAALAELTGINVAKGIGLLVKGGDDKAEIRCGIAQFDVKEGTMRADRVVLDTQDVRITGHGQVRLGPEELDLSIKGEPKKLRLTRLRTPVEVNGHLRNPSIGINAGKAVKQGAIAAVIGAVVTPFAAILAFVDPGLAKDENCAALLSEVDPHAIEAQPRRSTKK
jgi:AsmA family protein